MRLMMLFLCSCRRRAFCVDVLHPFARICAHVWLTQVGASPEGEGPEFRFVVECGEGDVWRTRTPVKLRNVMLGSTLQASKQHVCATHFFY